MILKNKKDKYPLKTKVLTLDKEDRQLAIFDYIHRLLIDFFDHEYDHIDDDFCCFLQEKRIPEQKAFQVTHSLFESIKTDFNVQFYYFEHKIESLKTLASVIDQNIMEIFSPTSLSKASEPFFSEKYWPWEMHGEVGLQEKNDKDITFVLSCPRSGSTIFRLILAAHPALFSPPELHLLPFNKMGDRFEEINKHGFEWMSEGLVEALVEAEGLSFEDARLNTVKMVQDNLPVSDVYRHLQDIINGRILVDKTPFYSCHPEWLQRAKALFPNAKFIFLTRHPYGMISSFVKLRLQQLTLNSFGCYSDSPWHLAEKWWLTGNQNIQDFVNRLPSEQSFFLRYEDLIGDTPGSMNRICEFLNIDFDERVLNPYAQVSDVMKSGIGDPNIMSRNAIDVSMADHWKKIKLPHPLSDTTLSMAKQLGYDFHV